MNRVEKALRLALKAHKGQVDKAGKAYILHPLRLAAKMPDDNHYIVALLHDTVEDSHGKVTLPAIQAAFGINIALAVDALTRRQPGMALLDGGVYEGNKPEPYLPVYIHRVKQNAIARRVKKADLADNMNLKRIPAEAADKWQKARMKRYAKALALIEK
jgi:(p)ppGpp synthase/HD superfamily hydrolase